MPWATSTLLILVAGFGICLCSVGLKISYIKECNGAPTNGLKLDNYSVTINPRGADWFSAWYTMSKGAHAVPKFEVKFNRCVRNGTQCKYLTSFRMQNACPKFEYDAAVWSPFVKAITPRWKCPIHPGQYITHNATFDSEMLEIFRYDLEKYDWHHQFEAYDENLQLFMCFAMGTSFVKF